MAAGRGFVLRVHRAHPFKTKLAQQAMHDLRLGIVRPLHGHAIAQRLRVVSQDILQVGESSLYPALQRLLVKGWVKAAWGVSENNRRARYYTITAAGKKHLALERAEFERLMGAMVRVLEQE